MCGADFVTPSSEEGTRRAGALILGRARELVERGWSRGSDARASSGAAVAPWSPEARCWSLLGALVLAADLPGDPDLVGLGPLRRALGALAELIEEPLLETWNDEPGRTQAQVSATLEAARRRCLEGA